MSCNTASSDQDNRDPHFTATGLSAVDGDATSLFEYIIRDKVWGANLDPPESAKNVIKPWHQRLSAEPSTQSNVDDQLAITVPFTCPVRLKSILINAGTGDFAPTRCRAFVNRPDGIDFDEVEQATADYHPADQTPLATAATLGNVGSGKAQADFALLRGEQGVVEYPVSVARFSHTNSITIVLSHSNATTLSRFFYLGFRGTALVLKAEPGERLNIGAANSADRPVDGVREKRGASQGLAGGSSRRTPPRYVVGDQAAAQRITQITEQAALTPRRSPRRNRNSAAAESPNTTPMRKRKPSPSQSGAGADDTESTPRDSQKSATTRTPKTAPPVRRRPSFSGPSASAGQQPSQETHGSQAQVSATASGSADPTRRRSLSQPPPNEVLLRQLHASNTTPSTKYPAAHLHARTPSHTAALTATPGRRILGTPRQPGPGMPSFWSNSVTAVSSSQPQTQAMQTPATDKRRKRNDALLASAQRTRERRLASRKSLLWGGVGGWAGGREESPMDLLRRLARAPDFVAPPTPSLDSISAPPGAARPGRSSTSSIIDASNSRTRARDSAASTSSRSSLSRATMLVPGESVPGDLTRDSNVSVSMDMDESLASASNEPGDRSRSRLSDIGIPRRASGVGLVRGGIFAGIADQFRASRLSTGSRVSFADQVSPSSMRFDDMSSRREDELERSLQQQNGGAQSFISASGIDLAKAKAIRRLDDLTRQSFFSDDGQLQYNQDEEDDEEEDESLEARRRKIVGRSMSETLDGEADGPVLFLGLGVTNDDDVQSQTRSDEEEQVSDTLAVEAADDDSDGLARRLDADNSRDLSDRLEISITGGDPDDSRASRVSFAEQDQVSFQVNDAYSSDDAVEYRLSVPELDLDDDDDDNASDAERDASTRLNLLDPKDLNALLKRRIVKKRKSRVSPHTGLPLPPLPTSVMRDIFSSFLAPSSSTVSSSLLTSSSTSAKRAKLDATVLDELDSAAHDFFADFAANLLTQAKTRSRRSDAGTSITEADVVAVLKRQGRVTQRNDASSLAHKLLPRELTDQMELSRWAKAGTVQTTLSGMLRGSDRRKAKARGNEGVAETTMSSSVALDDEEVSIE